jgi:hypothetical protein
MGKFNVTKNNVNMNSSALSGLFAKSTPAVVDETPAPVREKKEAKKKVKKGGAGGKKTFVISGEHVQIIENLVHTRRIEGNTDYLQKDAVAEIVEYFKNNNILKSKEK